MAFELWDTLSEFNSEIYATSITQDSTLHCHKVPSRKILAQANSGFLSRGQSIYAPDGPPFCRKQLCPFYLRRRHQLIVSCNIDFQRWIGPPPFFLSNHQRLTLS